MQNETEVHSSLVVYLACLIFSYYYPSVIMEMNERREFMKEMESLGKGHQYKTQIDAEISQVSLHF